MPLTQLPDAECSRVQGTGNNQSQMQDTVLSWSFYSPVTSGSGRQPSQAPDTEAKNMALSAKADRDLFLPVNSTGGHFVLGKHIPPGPGRWADFMRFLHVMYKHKHKPLKFLQKTGG